MFDFCSVKARINEGQELDLNRHEKKMNTNQPTNQLTIQQTNLASKHSIEAR